MRALLGRPAAKRREHGRQATLSDDAGFARGAHGIPLS